MINNLLAKSKFNSKSSESTNNSHVVENIEKASSTMNNSNLISHLKNKAEHFRQSVNEAKKVVDKKNQEAKEKEQEKKREAAQASYANLDISDYQGQNKVNENKSVENLPTEEELKHNQKMKSLVDNALQKEQNTKPQEDDNPKQETGFEFLESEEYTAQHKTQDEAQDIQVDTQNHYKIKRVSEGENQINSTNKKKHKFLDYFRLDNLFVQSDNNQLFSRWNVILSSLAIFILYKYTVWYMQSDNLLLTILKFWIPVGVLFFVIYFSDSLLACVKFLSGVRISLKRPFFRSTKENEIGVKLRKTFNSVKESKNFIAIIVMIASYTLAYISSIRLFNDIPALYHIGALFLFIAFVCAILIITKWHLASVIFGGIVVSSVMIPPAYFVDWNARELNVQQQRTGNTHILINRLTGDIEVIPEYITFNTKGSYYIDQGIPLYYNYFVSLQPTKSFLASMKLSKCKVEKLSNCDYYQDYYEAQGEQKVIDYITYISPTNPNKVYPITNFKDYGLYANTILKPILLELMRKNLHTVQLPLRESDYRFMLPTKMQSLLEGSITMQKLGNPNIKLALQQITMLPQ